MLHKFLATFLLLATAAALAQPSPQILVATGKEVHIQTKSAGTVICVGGEPTTQGPPCSPGTKRIFIISRMNVLEYQDVTGSAAAMLRGKNKTVAHCNLDENYFGHCWGTFLWEIPEMGGVWEGTWSAASDQGKRITINRALGFGYGGKLEGLQLEFDGVNPGGLPHAVFIARVTSK